MSAPYSSFGKYKLTIDAYPSVEEISLNGLTLAMSEQPFGNDRDRGGAVVGRGRSTGLP